jgi:hypothetical protein
VSSLGTLACIVVTTVLLVCLPGILTRCSIVATEVGCVVAAEASLRLQTFGDAVGGITDEHAEALYCFLENGVAYASLLLTGLKAVT